jgi:hypothetical protein
MWSTISVMLYVVVCYTLIDKIFWYLMCSLLEKKIQVRVVQIQILPLWGPVYEEYHI